MTKLLLIPALLFGANAFCQNYAVTAYTAPYEEIVGGMLHNETEWDDPDIQIDLEFPFTLVGVPVSALTQTGYGAEWGIYEGEILTAVGVWNDLISADVIADETPSPISWITEGATGNRILKIQYTDAAFYNEVAILDAASNRMSFQIWFYENESAIEFRFGPSNIPSPDIAFDASPGPQLWLASELDFELETVSFISFIVGDPTAPEFATFDTPEGTEQVPGLNAVPASGQVIRLVPTATNSIADEKPTFQIYPSLAEHTLYIRGDNAKAGPYRIMSMNGALVGEGAVNGQAIDISSLPTGSYLIAIEGYVTAQKFVKQ